MQKEIYGKANFTKNPYKRILYDDNNKNNMKRPPYDDIKHSACGCKSYY